MALSSLIGALCLGWTITLYGRRYAGASGIYEYIALAHGKSLGAFPAV